MNLYVAALAAFVTGSCADATASSVVIGNCNQINERINVSEGSTLTIINDCVPTKPEDSFTVSFYWLDSLSLSFLAAGYTNPYMEAVLSSGPIVLKNPVFSNVAEILRKLGERPIAPQYDEIDRDGDKLSDPGFKRFPLYSSKIIAKGNTEFYQDYSISDIPQNVINRLRIYDGEAKLIWPDIDAFSAFYNTDRWPTNFHMTYSPNNGNEELEIDSKNLENAWKNRTNAVSRYVLECTSMYRFIKKEEFHTYWENLKRLTNLIQRTEGGEARYAFQPAGDVKNTLPGSRSNMNAYEAIKYFTRETWPDDFLIARGGLKAEGCGQTAGMELAAVPRDLFALVAVIKPKSESLRLKGIVYKQDSRTALRTDINATKDVVMDSELPLISQNQSFVIPLRLELRYNMEQLLDITDDPDPIGLYELIKSLPDGEFVIDPKTYFKDSLIYGENSDQDEETSPDYSVDLPVIRKRISAFPPPKSTAVTQTYIYGEALDLVGLEVEDGVLAVRKTPRYALLSEGGFDGASCPFLYFREADGQLSLTGRILVGADNSEKSITEVIEVPVGTKSAVVMEKEPEITYLSTLEYRASNNAPWIMLSTKVRIEPGQTAEFKLPAQAGEGAALRVSGFYRTLGSYLETNLTKQRHPFKGQLYLSNDRQ